MALRKGGFRGLQKLIDSKKIGSIELNTGLQISGVFTEMITDEDNNVVFFKTEGPTALANREKELIGHGAEQNFDGFCSPIGKLKGISLAIEDMAPLDLKAYNFYDGKHISITYESGIEVKGLNVTGIRNVFGRLILIEFENCTVTYKDRILFSPDQGNFKLAVGSSIVSAYAGAADYRSFDNLYHVSATKTIQKDENKSNDVLENLYSKVRSMRDKPFNREMVSSIFESLKVNYPEDWLLPLELFEICYKVNDSYKQRILEYLNTLKTLRPAVAHLINDGINIIKN
jgi:phenylalanine-4-hydroxylase